MTQQLMESKLISFHKMDQHIENVLCDIVIESISTWRKIKLKTRDSKVAALIGSHNVDIKINYMAINSTLENATFMKKCSIINFTHTFNAATDSYEFEATPEYTYTFRERGNKINNDNCTLSFYINDAPLIAPFIQFEFNRQGTLNHKKSSFITVDLDDRIRVTSDTLFDITHKNNNKTIELNRYHILQTDIPEKTCNIDEIRKKYLDKIDKLNDIISLAHGKKVLCTSWFFNSENQNVVFYRSNYPKRPDITLNDHEVVIPKKFMGNYLQDAYNTYITSHYYDNLRLAINTLTIEKSLLEQSYLSLFQAYEAFLLTFKKTNNIETILPLKEFSIFRTRLQKNIDESVIPDKDARKRMKSKIGELNRPSLSDIADKFFKETPIDNKDLWPIFKDNNGISLSDLRNIIIHGETLPQDCHQNIFIAKEHLKFHLFRLVFSVLGWDIKQTNISEQQIAAHSKLNEKVFYMKHREELTRALTQ